MRVGNFCVRIFLVCLLWVSAFILQADDTFSKLKVCLQAKDYGSALQEVESVLKHHPNDIFSLRVKGVCLIELGKTDEAVSIFRHALKLKPYSLSCQYHLAQALAYQGSLREAQVLLEKVCRLNPESRYAQLSRAVLPEIKNLIQSRPILKDSKRWDFVLRFSGEYDDNVRARSENDNRLSSSESFRLVTAAYTEIRLRDEKIDLAPMTFGGAYTFYQSFHERSSLNDFDLTSHRPALFIRKSTKLAWMPFQTWMNADYTQSSLGYETFSDAWGLETGFDLQWLDWAVVRPSYNIQWKNFDFDTEHPEVFSRDGMTQSVGFNQYWYLFNHRMVLGMGYVFTWIHSEGLVFELESHGILSSVQISLPWKFRLLTRFDYESSDYVEFTDEPKRLDDAYTLTVSLCRALWQEDLISEVSFTQSISDSNYDFAEYERRVYSLSLSYYF